ncbi:MAG: hypothetical protein Q7S28_00665 [bacterium]|nr:hypothetical protein [bacterium]
MNKSFHRLLLVNIGIIAGSVLCAGAIAFFIALQISGVVKTIANARTLVARRTSQIENLATLKREAALADSYSVKINRLLPRQDELLRFRQFISRLAIIYRANVNFAFQGSPSPSNPSAGLPGFFNFSLNMGGSYEALSALLKNLETDETDYLVGIDNIDITREGGEYRMFAQGRLFFR